MTPVNYVGDMSTTHSARSLAASTVRLEIKIEHKMFSFISMNWRGRPLVSYRTIVELISNTTTTTGLRIRTEEDLNFYETGTKVSPAELAAVPLVPHKFHGDWNYTIAQSVNR
jgi:hypothetical protein